MKLKKGELIYQFKIELLETKPPVWRRIQLPASSSFWDLHVAIQDAMGWTDSHLHMFRVPTLNKRKEVKIGIPDDDWDDKKFLAGRKTPLAPFFWIPGIRRVYEYDFGEGWEHEVLLEGVLIPEPALEYPRCLAGENACPPEDCGGVGGYYNLLEIIRDPSHEEHEDRIIWLESMVPGNVPFAPNKFDPAQVHFDNPKKRLRNLGIS
jgi:hypothetical protein